MTATSAASSRAWEMIEREKKRDQIVRRATIAAWTVALILALVGAGLVTAEGVSVVHTMLQRNLSMDAILAAVTYVVKQLGLMALVLAAMGSVAIFLRQ